MDCPGEIPGVRWGGEKGGAEKIGFVLVRGQKCQELVSEGQNSWWQNTLDEKRFLLRLGVGLPAQRTSRGVPIALSCPFSLQVVTRLRIGTDANSLP